MKEFLSLFPLEKTNEIFAKVNEYLLRITKAIISFESITINRPLKQVYEYIVNFNKVMCAVEKKKESDYLYIDKLYIDKNKASITVKKMKNENKSEMFFSIIQLSSITSFVIIENVIGFVEKGNYLEYVKQYNQSYLKTIKESVEKEYIQL